MRLIATSLLVAMTGLYAVAVTQAGPSWAYVRAFAEAAMVGGLADWFAVTAIFRRPLGLPIPHTAVIPRNKARIADAIGEFVAVNFLSSSVVAARLENQDLAASFAQQLADRAAARRIADGLIDAAPSVLNLLDDEAVAEFLRRQIADLSKDVRFSAALGRGLAVLTDQGRHQPLLDAAIVEGWRALGEHEAAIRAQVSARTNWLLRLIAIDERAGDVLIRAIEDTLKSIADDPNHPVRLHVTEVLKRFSDDLQNAPELRARVAHVAADMLAHPAVASYFAGLGQSLKAALRDSATAPTSALRSAFADAIARLGAGLLHDEAVRRALNVHLRALLTEAAQRHGGDVGRLISETIRGWDAATVVVKLEQNVGRDLQYIRINGTLIGGLVGLAIHQATLLLA